MATRKKAVTANRSGSKKRKRSKWEDNFQALIEVHGWPAAARAAQSAARDAAWEAAEAAAAWAAALATQTELLFDYLEGRRA